MKPEVPGISLATVYDCLETLVPCALAQRSAPAAKETAEKIDDSVSKSQHGAAVCPKVATSLREIAVKTREMDELVDEIATASSEQPQGANQVNSAISQMDRIVQASAAQAEAGARVAEKLTSQATEVQGPSTNSPVSSGGARQSPPPRNASLLRALRTNPSAPKHRPWPEFKQRSISAALLSATFSEKNGPSTALCREHEAASVFSLV